MHSPKLSFAPFNKRFEIIQLNQCRYSPAYFALHLQHCVYSALFYDNLKRISVSRRSDMQFPPVPHNVQLFFHVCIYSLLCGCKKQH